MSIELRITFQANYKFSQGLIPYRQMVRAARGLQYRVDLMQQVKGKSTLPSRARCSSLSSCPHQGLGATSTIRHLMMVLEMKPLWAILRLLLFQLWQQAEKSMQPSRRRVMVEWKMLRLCRSDSQLTQQTEQMERAIEKTETYEMIFSSSRNLVVTMLIWSGSSMVISFSAFSSLCWQFLGSASYSSKMFLLMGSSRLNLMGTMKGSSLIWKRTELMAVAVILLLGLEWGGSCSCMGLCYIQLCYMDFNQLYIINTGRSKPRKAGLWAVRWAR